MYLGRFDRLFEDHEIFAGVTYTDAHVTITGMLIVAIALVVGAVIAAVNAVSAPKLRWLIAAVVPAIVCYVGVSVIGWYVDSFIVKPNELMRETPVHRAQHRGDARRRMASTRSVSSRFRRKPASKPSTGRTTRKRCRTSGCGTGARCRTRSGRFRKSAPTTTFPDIDIDRYEIDGNVRQMMLAARELNVDKLPESSRNWINEKLIYTHGYGVTMNPVNGFTTGRSADARAEQHAGAEHDSAIYGEAA